MFDKNGCIMPATYEGNVTDIKDEMVDDGSWHRYVTTMEQDALGDTICRKYADGVLIDFTRTSGQSWTTGPLNT